MNHNRERCIWQLWEVTSCPLARTLYQICRWWLEASPSLFPCLSNFASTFLKKHPLPLPANPFRIIEIHQWLPVPECRQKISDRRLPAQGSISSWFQSVLPRDDGPMLLLKKALHPYLLPLVECTLIGLPCNGRDRAQVIWMFAELNSKCVSRESRIRISFKVVLLLAIQENE